MEDGRKVVMAVGKNMTKTPFSQRNSFAPKRMLQVEGIDNELRTRLWNFIARDALNDPASWHDLSVSGPELDQFDHLISFINEEVMKLPHDTLGQDWRSQYKLLRDWFFSCPWYVVYDLLETLLQIRKIFPEDFVKRLNQVLEDENSGFRVVDDILVPITNPLEISEIQHALDGPSAVSSHINEAARLLSDRVNDNSRNVCKEAILAVEAAARILAGKPKATLGDALKEISRTNTLHPALKDSWLKLYGFASDAGGIRHASSADEPVVSRSLARYLLVSCSAFANYLLSLSSTQQEQTARDA